MGDGQHLTMGGSGGGNLVAGRRVAIDGIDPTVAPNDLGQGDGDVPPSGTDIDTGPTWPKPQAVEGGGERPPVDIVPQSAQFHAATLPVAPPHADDASDPWGTGSLIFREGNHDVV